MKRNILSADLNYILQHTKPIWTDLKRSRIFMTGGTGFIGTWLLETLLWANDLLFLDLTITVLTRNKSVFANKAPHLAGHTNINFCEGNVCDFTGPKGEFTHVIHGATDTNAKFNQAHPELMLETIIQGTRQVLDFTVQCQAEKILFLSSGAVYGKQPADLTHITESYTGASDLIDVTSAYGLAKGSAEHMCAIHANLYPIEIKIARCFAFVGPYLALDHHFAVGNFLRDGLTGNPIQVKSDGSAVRSYLYAADLVIYLLYILCLGRNKEAYNVGSPESISILDLAHLVAQQFNLVPTVQVAQTQTVNTLPHRYVPATKRARETFGLSQPIPLTDALQRTIHWHQRRKQY